MIADRTERARHGAGGGSFAGTRPAQAPRAAFFCRHGIPQGIGFALGLMMLAGIVPAAVDSSSAQTPSAARYFDTRLDRDGNGVEDLLDLWFAGQADWQDLRNTATAALDRRSVLGGKSQPESPEGFEFPDPATSDWAEDRVRLICLGARASELEGPRGAGESEGVCRLVHDIDRFGGVTVLAADAPGLGAFLAAAPRGRIMLDRDGVPALVESRPLVGADAIQSGFWDLGDDWSGTIAILDSGCDTAHGDLGDASDDDIDGPAPAVGDVGDWYPADGGWSLFQGYKVVGWHDVTDDFPEAQGPWDYHHHGTALASVAAGSGVVDPDYRGMAPGSRLTVVKFYDFDEIWHAWAGDFIAACDWTLAHREVYRVRTVLTAVNWDVDAGISDAVSGLLDAGLLTVAAMGNFGNDLDGPGYPALLPTVITAGAVDDAGAVAAYSGRGLPGQGKPDLLAPGGGLLTGGDRIMAADNEPDDTYTGRVGSSLAAAHVAGALHLMDEALLENGVTMPATAEAAMTRAAVLKLTSAPVELQENATGTGHEALGFPSGHDPVRGWGMLRVDAAVQALLSPLLPGRDQVDTLTINWEKPVVARRLITDPGVRFLVEAVPSGNLDVTLEIVDPRWLEDDPLGRAVIRQDINGRGVSEFAYVRPEGAGWLFVVVKRRAGLGTVTLRLREAESFTHQGASATLPGPVSGSPNSGPVTGHVGHSLAIPSRVTVDLAARSLNLLDQEGNFRPGWPVFVFPHPSSLGGLGLPMVWDLDGVEGDEIVAASEFGSVYFFQGNGDVVTVDLELNQPLTTPVGMVAPGGLRLAVMVDKGGTARAWSYGPALEAQSYLGSSKPLDPAVGLLGGNGNEAVVVAFADGHVAALDADLDPLPGWPVDLNVSLTVPPVLVDLDGDGLHEVVLPILDSNTGQLSMQVLNGSGQPGPGNGTGIPSPGGGRWLGISSPVVAGGYWTDDLRVAVAGLSDNGLAGDQARWHFGFGSLMPEGIGTSISLPGFGVRATTDEGDLKLDQLLLPTPLTWDYRGAGGNEIDALINIHWNEVLYGLTSIPGSATAWYSEGPADNPLAVRQPIRPGGKNDTRPGHLGTMLVDAGEAQLRVEIIDNKVGIVPVVPGKGSTPFWRSSRADGRNSGAFPAAPVPSTTGPAPARSRSLHVFPNPGGGQFNFRVEGGTGTASLTLEIFDVRGRRLHEAAWSSGQDILRWDGTDREGRPLAAGAYLAVVRGASSGPLVKRVVLTR